MNIKWVNIKHLKQYSEYSKYYTCVSCYFKWPKRVVNLVGVCCRYECLVITHDEFFSFYMTHGNSQCGIWLVLYSFKAFLKTGSFVWLNVFLIKKKRLADFSKIFYVLENSEGWDWSWLSEHGNLSTDTKREIIKHGPTTVNEQCRPGEYQLWVARGNSHLSLLLTQLFCYLGVD